MPELDKQRKYAEIQEQRQCLNYLKDSIIISWRCLVGAVHDQKLDFLLIIYYHKAKYNIGGRLHSTRHHN